MSSNSQHVVPNGDKWSVRKTGASRASAVFNTRREAIERAREIARNQQAMLFIHGKDGRIKERIVFQNDADPSKG
jgi:hypothetical protein